MKHRGNVYSMYMSMERMNVCCIRVNVSLVFQIVETREVTLMQTITDGTFIVKIIVSWFDRKWRFDPGVRDLWPLHFDGETLSQQEGVRGWTNLLKVRDWLILRLILCTGEISSSFVLTRVLPSGSRGARITTKSTIVIMYRLRNALWRLALWC